MRCCFLVVSLALASLVEASPRPSSWTVGDTAFCFDPAARQIAISRGGVALGTLSQFGPEFLWQGSRPIADVAVELLAAEPGQGGVRCRYKAVRDGESIGFSVFLWPTEDGLKVRIQSASTRCAAVRSGRVVAKGKWFRISYTRNAEPYGQPFWPRVAMLPERQAYLSASWDMAASNGSTWDSTDQRFAGEGSFSAGVDVVYGPRSDGSRMPVDETMTLRVGRDLWQTVPLPVQKPSEFRQALAGEVFLDIWGGTAREAEYLLRHLAVVTQSRARWYTVFQNWQAGGFDALLPDSILMPDYPPNPGIGSIEDFQRLSQFARSVGHFAMRTNYMVLRDAAPSVRAGRARPALGPDGKPKWHTRPSDWLALAGRQEEEIHRLFGTTAGFTDQLTSGGAPWSYADFDARLPNAGAMGPCLLQQRQLARRIKDAHGGPLGSETDIDEQLLGEFVDSGDFGIFDGHHRAFTPEFKLRRIHHLSTFHGMGLAYRFFEMPPFPRFHRGDTAYRTDPAQVDDYRAAEILFGNGGYVFYDPSMPWDEIVTECLLVGALQKHYALTPVQSVHYWKDNRWQTLPEVVAAGIDPMPTPWLPQADCLRRIQVHYANGLCVVVNRLAEPFPVQADGESILLPQAGWVAWLPEGRLLAYSAYAPGTRHRVDFLQDRTAGLQYLNPRGQETLGQTRPTLWLGGRLATTVDPRTGDAWIDGKLRKYEPPKVESVTRVDFRFDRGTQGWVGQSDLGPLRIEGGALKSQIVGSDPAMASPPLDLAPDSVTTLVLRMRISCGRFGQLYFRAAGVDAAAEAMCVRFDVAPGPAFRDVRIPVGKHPLWNGHRIIQLRLDPEHGESPGLVEIESIRGE